MRDSESRSGAKSGGGRKATAGQVNAVTAGRKSSPGSKAATSAKVAAVPKAKQLNSTIGRQRMSKINAPSGANRTRANPGRRASTGGKGK